MTADELRAMTAQGPAVIMVQRKDMLKLLDERELLAAVERDNKRLAFVAILFMSLFLWSACFIIGTWIGFW